MAADCFLADYRQTERYVGQGRHYIHYWSLLQQGGTTKPR